MVKFWNGLFAHDTAGDRVRAAGTAVLIFVIGTVVGLVVASAYSDIRDVEWNWTVLADVAVGAAALAAAIGGVATLMQRTRADQRAEWWKRAERCGDYLVDGDADTEDDKYRLGVGLLRALELDDSRTGRRETEYLSALGAAATLDPIDPDVDNEGEEGGADE